ncbi:MAG: hypothetical protein HY518_01310 [Candidatus Aenigmarchaeota archaeon]|nr:hypothetical protein [Candidatus Aenigmarchaeota archaeon]
MAVIFISGCTTPPQYCGDRICQPGEDQYSCPQDCGEIPPSGEIVITCGDKVCDEKVMSINPGQTGTVLLNNIEDRTKSIKFEVQATATSDSEAIVCVNGNCNSVKAGERTVLEGLYFELVKIDSHPGDPGYRSVDLKIFEAYYCTAIGPGGVVSGDCSGTTTTPVIDFSCGNYVCEEDDMRLFEGGKGLIYITKKDGDIITKSLNTVELLRVAPDSTAEMCINNDCAKVAAGESRALGGVQIRVDGIQYANTDPSKSNILLLFYEDGSCPADCSTAPAIRAAYGYAEQSAGGKYYGGIAKYIDGKMLFYLPTDVYNMKILSPMYNTAELNSISVVQGTTTETSVTMHSGSPDIPISAVNVMAVDEYGNPVKAGIAFASSIPTAVPVVSTGTSITGAVAATNSTSGGGGGGGGGGGYSAGEYIKDGRASIIITYPNIYKLTVAAPGYKTAYVEGVAVKAYSEVEQKVVLYSGASGLQLAAYNIVAYDGDSGKPIDTFIAGAQGVSGPATGGEGYTANGNLYVVVNEGDHKIVVGAPGYANTEVYDSIAADEIKAIRVTLKKGPGGIAVGLLKVSLVPTSEPGGGSPPSVKLSCGDSVCEEKWLIVYEGKAGIATIDGKDNIVEVLSVAPYPPTQEAKVCINSDCDTVKPGVLRALGGVQFEAVPSYNSFDPRASHVNFMFDESKSCSADCVSISLTDAFCTSGKASLLLTNTGAGTIFLDTSQPGCSSGSTYTGYAYMNCGKLMADRSDGGGFTDASFQPSEIPPGGTVTFSDSCGQGATCWYEILDGSNQKAPVTVATATVRC